MRDAREMFGELTPEPLKTEKGAQRRIDRIRSHNDDVHFEVCRLDDGFVPVAFLRENQVWRATGLASLGIAVTKLA